MDTVAVAELSIDAQARQSIDTCRARLRLDLDRHVAALVDELTAWAARTSAAARDEARRVAGEETECRVTQAVAEATAALEADVDRRVIEAVTEARERWDEDHHRAAEEIAHELEQKLAAVESDAHDAVRQARLEADEAVARAERARVGARELGLQALARLLASVERLDAATSLKTALDALAHGAAAEVTRTMLLVVRGQSLSTWEAHGFDATPGPLHLPLAEAGPFAAAVERGLAVPVRADEDATLANGALALARVPAGDGLVVPVMLGRRAVAVLYADEGGAADDDVPAAWPAILQLLAKYASRRLEALTALRTAELVGGVQAAEAVEGESDPIHR